MVMNAEKSDALKALREKVSNLRDDQILQGCVLLRAAEAEAERLVRALMIDEYGIRHGEQAADELMESLGL